MQFWNIFNTYDCKILLCTNITYKYSRLAFQDFWCNSNIYNQSDYSNDYKKSTNSFILKYRKIKLYRKYIKKLLPINTLDINFKYGFEEPNITAITYGFKDLINSYVANLLNYFLTIKKYSINIIPTLKEKNLYLSINSIIYISIGKLIFIGTKLLLKRYKGEL